MTRITPEEYAAQNERPLYGMQNWGRWADASVHSVSNSDIDMWRHSRNGNRHLFTEFKAIREDPGILATPELMRDALYRNMGGQIEGLESLSCIPGAQVVILWDPYHLDASNDRMDPDMPLHIEVIRNGMPISMKKLTTIGRWAKHVLNWQNNEGPLAEAVVDKNVLALQMAAKGASPREMAEALLPTPPKKPEWYIAEMAKRNERKKAARAAAHRE